MGEAQITFIYKFRFSSASIRVLENVCDYVGSAPLLKVRFIFVRQEYRLCLSIVNEQKWLIYDSNIREQIYKFSYYKFDDLYCQMNILDKMLS